MKGFLLEARPEWRRLRVLITRSLPPLPRRVKEERRSDDDLENEPAADDGEDCGEGEAQGRVGHAHRGIATDDDAGDRADQKRAKDVRVDRAHDPMPSPR